MAKLTQKTILQTFDAMIREMPFDKITVSALVARCEISPNTFYYHYQDIYALLDKWLDIKLMKYPPSAYLTSEWKSIFKCLLHDLQTHPDIVRNVFSSITRERVERYLFDVLEMSIYQLVRQRAEGTHLSQESLRITAGTFCYSLFGFIVRFVWDGMEDDIDAVFDPVLNFLDDAILNYALRSVKS